MKLDTLILHSADILNIVLKSPKSSDTLVSEFLHKKKYIGSKERKFISDIVFSTIRILSLAEYCLSSSFSDNFNIEEYKQAKNQKLPLSKYFPLYSDNFLKLLISTTTILIQEKHLGLTNSASIIHLINLLGKDYKIKDELIKAISVFSESDITTATSLYHRISSRFVEIKSFSEALLDKNYEDFLPEDKFLFSIYCSLPIWIIDILYKKYKNLSIVFNLCESLKEQAQTTIRVNQYRTHKKFVFEHLNGQNIEVKLSQLSPSALILGKRVQLNTDPLFKQGLFEVQDEGSQLVSFALAPEKKAKVLDACAGAGGKTLHIADIQEDTGKIIASDTDILRLKELRRRARKHNYKSIETVFAKNGHLPESLKGAFEYVLVDAPCSGMGTVRRLPMTKWRITPELLEKHSRKQLKLLEYYSQFVNKSGVLVYSTCSFMHKENDEVIASFLEKHSNFEPDSLIEPFKKMGVNFTFENQKAFKITLLPSIHHCDGFFIARLVKKG